MLTVVSTETPKPVLSTSAGAREFIHQPVGSQGSRQPGVGGLSVTGKQPGDGSWEMLIH